MKHKMLENIQMAPELKKAWSLELTALNEAFKAEGRQVDNMMAITLAQTLENTKREMERTAYLNETTQTANVGPFKKYAFDMIVGMIPNLIAQEIVSVQPLKQKLGHVFYLKYIFSDNTQYDPRTGHSAMIEDNHKWYSAGKKDGSYTSTAATTTSINLGHTKIVPGTLRTTVTVAGGQVVFMGANITGNGVVENLAKVSDTGTTAYTGTATLNVETGVITFSVSIAGTASTSTFTYQEVDLETAPINDTKEVDLQVEEVALTAVPRKLRTRWAFDAAYDMEMQFGVDMSEQLAATAAAEIQFEIDSEIMNDIYSQAGTTTTWSKTAPTGVQDIYHKLTFHNNLISAKNGIFTKTRRALGNFLIVGQEGLDTLEALGAPYFQATTESNPSGPYKAGTTSSGLVVYANPYWATNKYLVGYRGKSWIDAGYVYAPYLPIFTTQLLMLDDFQARQGFATSYAKKMLNPLMYVAGTITA